MSSITNMRSPHSGQRCNASGFTLMEVLITVAVIGILAAIAIPNYSDYIRRSKRADARGVLLQTAQALERFRTEKNTYTGSDRALQSPESGTAIYVIQSTANAAGNGYTISATPVTSQSMASDECGVMTVDNTGLRTAHGDSSDATLKTCWAR